METKINQEGDIQTYYVCELDLFPFLIWILDVQLEYGSSIGW